MLHEKCRAQPVRLRNTTLKSGLTAYFAHLRGAIDNRNSEDDHRFPRLAVLYLPVIIDDLYRLMFFYGKYYCYMYTEGHKSTYNIGDESVQGSYSNNHPKSRDMGYMPPEKWWPLCHEWKHIAANPLYENISQAAECLMKSYNAPSHFYDTTPFLTKKN